MASEVGVLHVDPKLVTHKGRLEPGRMFLIDFEQGRLIPDAELKKTFSERLPYRQWLNEQRIDLGHLDPSSESHGFSPRTLIPRMQASVLPPRRCNLCSRRWCTSCATRWVRWATILRSPVSATSRV